MRRLLRHRAILGVGLGVLVGWLSLPTLEAQSGPLAAQVMRIFSRQNTWTESSSNDMTSAIFLRIPNSTTLPATCTEGDIYQDTNAATELYICTATDTWTAAGSSGITSGTTTITGGADTAVCFDDGGVINCADTGFTFGKAGDTVTITSSGTPPTTGALNINDAGNVGTIALGSSAFPTHFFANATTGAYGIDTQFDMGATEYIYFGDSLVDFIRSFGDGRFRILSLDLTAATATVTRVGEVRSATHAYSWTNAMVVALGATTTGDITMATLPAKTVVTNAYMVINTAATVLTGLTVACGRTGATYIDYIVASDGKAAANTVYGDASAERGTNLVGYDLPSYTGTTDIKCHFISSVENLDQTATSTGTLVLTTTLAP